MNFEDFIKDNGEPIEQVESVNKPIDVVEDEIDEEDIELDVQKAVVESLAAEKAEQEEQIRELRKRIVALTSKVALLENQLALKKEEITKNGERLLRNEEKPQSNQVALIDRSIEIVDKFEGESRDHLLEVIKEARDAAEKNGRFRRAQILESILVANQPLGTLKEKREALEKIFRDNQNILSGPVINTLDKMGISYKCGENYLLPSEIVKRIY